MNRKELKLKLLEMVELEMQEAERPLEPGIDLKGLVRQAKATARAGAFVEVVKMLKDDELKPARD